MNKQAAEAAAEALLEPGVQRQDVERRRRDKIARQARCRRFISAYALVGAGLACLFAYLTALPMLPAGWGGAAIGAGLGWLVLSRIERRRVDSTQ